MRKLILVAFFLVIFFVSGRVPGTPQTFEDFSDPLLSVFKELTADMPIAKINIVLGRYASGNRIWRIEEPDVRKQSGIWDASFEYFIPNFFVKGEYIRSVLYIYFSGTTVDCIFYRYWGDGYYEPFRKGRSCARIEYSINSKNALKDSVFLILSSHLPERLVVCHGNETGICYRIFFAGN